MRAFERTGVGRVEYFDAAQYKGWKIGRVVSGSVVSLRRSSVQATGSTTGGEQAQPPEVQAQAKRRVMDNRCDPHEGSTVEERSRKNCPVRKEAQETVELSGETLRALRRLRRQFRYCHLCIDLDGCPFRAEFHAAVQQALLEIYEEWNLK